MNLDAYKLSEFPDGQPHIKLEGTAHDIINCSIRTADELVQVLMLHNILKRQGFTETQLNLHYLMGGRMDRAISINEPETLKVIGDMITQSGFESVYLTFPHSQTSLDAIRDKHGRIAERRIGDERSFIKEGINKALNRANTPTFGYVTPDAGAEKVFENYHSEFVAQIYRNDITHVPASKVRDMHTGKLSAFRVNADMVPETCIIVDDLCDGGGTFMGLAKELRAKGAKFIGLVVYHGIFSKGQSLDGIDFIYTSNSFRQFWPGASDLVFQEVI